MDFETAYEVHAKKRTEDVTFAAPAAFAICRRRMGVVLSLLALEETDNEDFCTRPPALCFRSEGSYARDMGWFTVATVEEFACEQLALRSTARRFVGDLNTNKYWIRRTSLPVEVRIYQSATDRASRRTTTAAKRLVYGATAQQNALCKSTTT